MLFEGSRPTPDAFQMQRDSRYAIRNQKNRSYERQRFGRKGYGSRRAALEGKKPRAVHLKRCASQLLGLFGCIVGEEEVRFAHLDLRRLAGDLQGEDER